ncbi:MAG: Txe/YoeB family addiction module toxin [Cryomorphaceae bacterium]
MSYKLDFSKTALKDIEKHKKSGDKAIIGKIRKLLLELMEHPTEGTGQPEMLKGNLKGFYSRRINRKHRLVYSVDGEKVTVHILSAFYHYGDK